MQRERIERLKELFDKAMEVMEHEWSFGQFKQNIEDDKNEAEQIFAELMQESY